MTDNTSAWSFCVPQELLLHIFSYLDAKSLLYVTCVCSEWKSIAEDNTLWTMLLARAEPPVAGETISAALAQHSTVKQLYKFIEWVPPIQKIPWGVTATGIDRVEAFSITIAGSKKVGKTALSDRFLEDTFTENTATRLKDSREWARLVKAGNTVLRALVSETDETNPALNRELFLRAEGIIICYDLTRPSSISDAHVHLEVIRRTYATLNNYQRRKKPKRRFPMFLFVGTKRDLVTTPNPFNKESQQERSQRWGIDYIETSAKTGEGVDEAFYSILKKLCVRRKRTKFARSTQNKPPRATAPSPSKERNDKCSMS